MRCVFNHVYCSIHTVSIAGAAFTALEYAKLRPAGKAIFKGAAYRPPPEAPDGEYPLWLSTGAFK
jgi:hypothetical protein